MTPGKPRWPSRRVRIVLFVLAAALPAGTYGLVEVTSTPSFCRSCHEIAPAVASWERSEHAVFQGRARATCRDCHVPAWSHPLDVLRVKLAHGVNDTYQHLDEDDETAAKDFYFRLKASAIRDVTDETCRGCHEEALAPDKDVIKTADGAVIRGLHSSEEAKKLRCTTCHRNMGHGPHQ